MKSNRVCGMLFGLALFSFKLDAITAQRYAQLLGAYQHLSKMKVVPQEQGANFVRSLLAENWERGTKRSANMTKWATDIAKKAKLDLHTILPRKVEVPANLKEKFKDVVSTALTSGVVATGLAIAAGVASGDLSTPAVLQALSSGLTSGALWGATEAVATAVAGPRSAIAQAAPAVVSSLTGGVPAGIELPALGASIPGWALLSASTAFQGVVLPQATQAFQASGVPSRVKESAENLTASDVYESTKRVASYLYGAIFGADQ